MDALHVMTYPSRGRSGQQLGVAIVFLRISIVLFQAMCSIINTALLSGKIVPVDKEREGKRLYKCWCKGLVTNYLAISRADAVKLLPAVLEEKAGRDRQLVHEMLIDSRAIVLATERWPGCW